MFVLSNLLMAVAQALSMILHLYIFIIVARALVSWVSADPYNPIVRFLCSVTDPVLWRVRRWVPAVIGGIDFSPVVVIVGLYFLDIAVLGSLRDLAYQLR